MNTNQLQEALHGIENFNGVYSRDQFKQCRLYQGTYIVNTQPSSMPGEHWFVVDIRGRDGVIFDSYGFISPVFSHLTSSVI